MRGLVILVGLILFTAIACVWFPMFFLPSLGIGAALPVIYLPGEKLFEFPIIGEFTNTLLAAVITTIVGWLFVLPVAANLREKPGRWQAMVEAIVETFDNLAQSTAGFRQGRMILPLMISIFLFVAIANVMKIVPGVDSVGLIHCAGIHAYPSHDFVEVKGYPIHEDDFLPGFEILKNEEAINPGEVASEEDYDACHEKYYGHGDEEHADEEHAEDDHAEDEAAVAAGTDAGDSDTEADANEESLGEEAAEAVALEEADEEIETPAEDRAEGESAAEDVVNPDMFIVTPFVRGATTDLVLTLAISIIAMLTVEYFGIKELGVLGWGVKFINLPALMNLGKNPMGVIDFVVGLLEIVLEFAKVVSFAFRLFGAMFGGQILMFVVVFLLATVVPFIVVVLEVFIGFIQAFVFAMLFLMFSVVAMTPHHHDDHEHDEAHAH